MKMCTAETREYKIQIMLSLCRKRPRNVEMMEEACVFCATTRISGSGHLHLGTLTPIPHTSLSRTLIMHIISYNIARISRKALSKILEFFRHTIAPPSGACIYLKINCLG